LGLTGESYGRIIDKLHEGLFFVNKNRVISYWNKAAEQISGFSAEEVVGKSCSDNILSHLDLHGNSLCADHCPLSASIQDGKPREELLYMHHQNGHRLSVSNRINTLTDESDNVIGGIVLFTQADIPVGNYDRALPEPELINHTLCPRCHSEYSQMVHRKKLVKLFTHKKKYLCANCGKQFYA